MRRAEVKELIIVVVTATVTVVVCQWWDRPAPFCCPGGQHVLREDGTWAHRFPEREKGAGPMDGKAVK